MTAEDNFSFTPKKITAVGLAFGEGTNIRISIGIIQRTAALRAYNSFSECRNWGEKLSAAYVVAITTRSADSLLMRIIQDQIPVDPPFVCVKCKDATIGTRVIRDRIFPQLSELRTHANKLIHHLDTPENQGVATLNIQGVFEYCYHLFQENSHALMGEVPVTEFQFTKCKVCRNEDK